MDDYQLFKFLTPKVFEMFSKFSTGSEQFIKVICTHCFSDVVSDLLTHVVCEDFVIFKRETFLTIAQNSLEWELFQQIYFWSLVRAEGVHFDWIVPFLPKIDFYKHHEAALQALIYLRTYGNVNLTLVRQIFSREVGDPFTLNALKV